MKDYRPDIINDFERLDYVVRELADYQREFSVGKRSDIVAAAYQLQHLYTGLEKIIEKSLASRNIKIGKNEHYHKQLLKTYIEHFSLDENEIVFMVALLAFRHFARSAYGYELDAERIKEKTATALTVWPDIKAKIFAQMDLGSVR